jgi:hypothetical protein
MQQVTELLGVVVWRVVVVFSVLLLMQKRDDATHSSSTARRNAPEHYDEAVRRGAVGSTGRPEELVDMILRALRDARPRARWWRPERQPR